MLERGSVVMSTPPATSTCGTSRPAPAPPSPTAPTSSPHSLSRRRRMGGVDTDAAERFQFEEPERFAAVDRRANASSAVLLAVLVAKPTEKTPLTPAIVWCNCPHMTGFDWQMKVEARVDLTAARTRRVRACPGPAPHAGAAADETPVARVDNVPGFDPTIGSLRVLRGASRPRPGCARPDCSKVNTSSPSLISQDVRDRVHFFE